MKKIKRIRIGKDINVEWKVDVEGLKGMALAVELVDPKCGRTEVDMFDVSDDNTLMFSLKGTSFSLLGDYSIVLTKNKDQDGQSVLDATKAFTLVPTTDEERGCDILDNPTIKLYSGTICKKVEKAPEQEEAPEADGDQNGPTPQE